MHHPMKQLPERAISEDEAREILRDGEYCVVATVDADGPPTPRRSPTRWTATPCSFTPAPSSA